MRHPRPRPQATGPQHLTLLAQLPAISRAETNRRVTTAAQVRRRHTMTGQAQQPLRPALAAAQAAGTNSPEKAAMVTNCLTGLEKITQIPAGQIDAAEETLTQHAEQFGPRELNSCQVTDGEHPQPQRGPVRQTVHPGHPNPATTQKRTAPTQSPGT